MTQSPEQAQRAPRGRLLIVGGGADAAAAEASDGRLAIQVRDVFCAIGELTRATAREPIDVVLMCGDALDANAENAAAALRRVDPAVRIVMMGSGGRSEAPSGFDAVISGPPANDVMQRKVQEHHQAERTVIHEEAAQDRQPAQGAEHVQRQAGNPSNATAHEPGVNGEAVRDPAAHWSDASAVAADEHAGSPEKVDQAAKLK